MSPTLAIVPAKRHSQGVPDKNWKPITPDGWNCASLALTIGLTTCDRAVVTLTDGSATIAYNHVGISQGPMFIHRPTDLPDTMLAVVQHALEAVPGPDDEIIVLLQPSSPLRTAETVRKAIQMLRDDPHADSVVSVSPSYPWEWSLIITGYNVHFACQSRCAPSCTTALAPLHRPGDVEGNWWDFGPARRQDCQPTYKRDGVVYAFRREAFTRCGDIYGASGHCLPLHTPPLEALSIDTHEDWEEAVKRLANRAKPCDNARESSVSV